MTSESTRNTSEEELVLRDVGGLFEHVLSRPAPTNIVDLWKEHLEIRSKIDQINEKQSKLSNTNQRLAQPRTESLADFLQWADQIGVKRERVDVVAGQNLGFELRAKSEIGKGDIVVSVPRHAMFSLDLARKSALLKKAFEQDPIVKGMQNVGLALFLCAHWLNDDNSKWKSYISVLPHAFNTPIFYTTDQLLQLKPSPIFEEALLFYRAIIRQFAYFLIGVAKNRIYEHGQKKKGRNEGPAGAPPFYNTPFTVANFTPNLYMWAVGVVTTRGNHIPSDIERTEDGKPAMIPALIPVFDFANHEFPAEATDEFVAFSADDESAQIVSPVDVSSGSVVTMFYGRRSNGDHLLHNGFVPRGENRNDRYKLRIGIPKNDKQFDEKRALLSKISTAIWVQPNVLVFDLINKPDAPFSSDLVRFAQVFVSDNLKEESLQSKDTRKKAVEFLKTRFSLLEKAYGDATGDVEAVDVGGDIARLKTSEKKILSFARLHCDKLDTVIA